MKNVEVVVTVGCIIYRRSELGCNDQTDHTNIHTFYSTQVETQILKDDAQKELDEVWTRGVDKGGVQIHGGASE